MSYDNPECLACCKGAPPYFLCRVQHDCICHLEKGLMAQKKHKASGHRDPTATTAIGNVMKGQKR